QTGQVGGPEGTTVPARGFVGRRDGRRGASGTAGKVFRVLAPAAAGGVPGRCAAVRGGIGISRGRARGQPVCVGPRGGDRRDASRDRGGAPGANREASGEGSEIGAGAEGDAADLVRSAPR